MGVRASMSVSIVIDNDLWGLIACHGYGEFGIRVSLPIRELCRSIVSCSGVIYYSLPNSQIELILTTFVFLRESVLQPISNDF
jgi:light-regulated signal transduction histidine kinase (bacteriophytochrome)